MRWPRRSPSDSTGTMAERTPATPDEQVRPLYERAESQTAAGFERLVRGDAFGELLAQMTENVMGLTRIGFDIADLVLRNLRIAGRSDIARLGRALARTEQKLERVLQEVEELRNEVERPRAVEEVGQLPAGSGRGGRGSAKASGQ
jgi:hypothetical protein